MNDTRRNDWCVSVLFFQLPPILWWWSTWWRDAWCVYHIESNWYHFTKCECIFVPFVLNGKNQNLITKRTRPLAVINFIAHRKILLYNWTNIIYFPFQTRYEAHFRCMTVRFKVTQKDAPPGGSLTITTIGNIGTQAKGSSEIEKFIVSRLRMSLLLFVFVIFMCVVSIGVNSQKNGSIFNFFFQFQNGLRFIRSFSLCCSD